MERIQIEIGNKLGHFCVRGILHTTNILRARFLFGSVFLGKNMV